MAAYRIDAFDIQMADTRRAMCAGSLIRSFFAPYSSEGERQMSEISLGGPLLLVLRYEKGGRGQTGVPAEGKARRQAAKRI